MLINPMLSDDRKLPYYIQLYDYFKKEILGGVLPAGTRLPSIRSLAAQLSISATPVELAYQQLVSEGFVTSRPRSGYIVQPMHAFSGAEAAGGPAERQGLQLTQAVLPITPRDPQQYAYDFHISKNDFSLFPYKIWRSLFQEQLANPDLLQYGDPQGEPALRGSIAAHLRQFRGCAACRSRSLSAAISISSPRCSVTFCPREPGSLPLKTLDIICCRPHSAEAAMRLFLFPWRRTG